MGFRVDVLESDGGEVWSGQYAEAIDDRINIELPPETIVVGQIVRVTKSNPNGSGLRLNEVEVYGTELVLGPHRVVEFDLNASDQSADSLRLDSQLRIDGATLVARFIDSLPATEGMRFKLLDTRMTTGGVCPSPAAGIAGRAGVERLAALRRRYPGC